MDSREKQKKIDLLNTLHSKVVGSDADGETCYYVHVLLDTETRAVLKQLGKDDSWIASYAEVGENEEEVIDISRVAFKYAKWWNEDIGFSLKKGGKHYRNG